MASPVAPPPISAKGQHVGRACGTLPSCPTCFRARAILGSDAGLDVMPAQIEGGEGISPLHMFTLVALGANILDNGDFEQLSAEAQARGRWEFLLTLAPMRIVGGTGSPLNPIATF